MYDHSARRPDGYEIAVGPKGTEEHDTKQCAHCGGHFRIVKGSGKIRGFCTCCMKVTCGNPACNEHFPLEERMALYEKGLLGDIMHSREQILPQHKKLILP